MSDDTGFDQAIAEARRHQDGMTEEHSAAARPILLEHGRRTPVAVCWLHGYTNCPRQFEALGRMCHERGWNVWIPLAPHHGFANRFSDATSLLTSAGLEAWGSEAVDVCRGLGERVVVGGLSMGGTVSAMLGLRRADVGLALPMAPLLSPLPGPPVLSRAGGAALRRLPNLMVWWDGKARDALPGPKHVYYCYSTRGIAEILALGFAFVGQARRAGPAAASFRFVLNDNDESMRNTFAEAVLRRWKRRGVANADAFRLGVDLGLRHDFIDPEQPYANTAVAYPLIVQAIEEALARPAATRGGA